MLELGATNVRRLARRVWVAASILGAMTCGGKVVVDQVGGGGAGAGGSARSTSTMGQADIATEGPGPGPSQVTVGVGGAGGSCRTCGEFFGDVGEQGTLDPFGPPLCRGESQAFWKELLSCACSSCTSQCSADVCFGGGPLTDVCGTCLGNAFTGACMSQFQTCVNDL